MENSGSFDPVSLEPINSCEGNTRKERTGGTNVGTEYPALLGYSKNKSLGRLNSAKSGNEK